MTYRCSYRTVVMAAFLAMFAAMYGTSCAEDAASGSDADTDVDTDADVDVDTGDGDPDNDAQLTWDQNLEADLAGYKVHYGTVPDDYDTFIDVGYTSTPESPTYTVLDLEPGTYHFAVTAYDYSGNESDYSDEESKNVL